VQKHAGEQRDQDRPCVDEHRRGARIDLPLGAVEDDVVEPEPEHAAEGEQRQVAPRGQRLAPHEHEHAECGARDEQPAERERPGREVVARRADADERRAHSVTVSRAAPAAARRALARCLGRQFAHHVVITTRPCVP
jgi:hypothetical protein